MSNTGQSAEAASPFKFDFYSQASGIGYAVPMIIREERPGDQIAIGNITAEAFAAVEHSNQTEPQIVERLRASGDLTSSLVAIIDGALVGHVAFSPVTIDGQFRGWFGLGPVSVDPAYQGRGIGSASIREGLAQLRSRRAVGCVVLGDPGYYRRFGFCPGACLRYEEAPADYFVQIMLAPGEPPTGQVRYAPAFR